MSPTTTPPNTQALVQAQAQTRAQIDTQIAAIVAASVAGFTGWYSTQQITDWAAHLVKVIEPLLRVLAQNTDAYTARVVTGVAGKKFRPVGRIEVANLRAGITHAGAYARAADVYRWQQSRWDLIAADIDAGRAVTPPDLAAPVDAAVTRALAVADMDGQLVVQQQAQATLSEADDRGLITGWRRVIHPELSKSGTCGLCIAASDRVYRGREPLPVHDRCKCVPYPIRGDNDPGSILNSGDLRQLYQDAGSTGRADLKRTRYRVDDNGELGPVLTPEGQPIRTPRQVRDDSNRPARRAKTPEQVRETVQRLLAQQVQAQAKVHDLAQADPGKWGGYAAKLDTRIDGLRAELASL